MNKPISYFIGEGLLIVFSILMALGVNEWRVRNGQHAEEHKAVADIAAELVENRALLDGLPDYHRSVGNALNQLAQDLGSAETADPRTPIELFMSLDNLRPSVIIQQPPQDVSWQTAKDRGVAARFDYETAKTLSLAYDSQMSSVNDVYEEVNRSLIRPDMYKAQDQDAALGPLIALFYEMSAREVGLMERIDQSLAALREDYPKTTAKAIGPSPSSGEPAPH